MAVIVLLLMLSASPSPVLAQDPTIDYQAPDGAAVRAECAARFPASVVLPAYIMAGPYRFLGAGGTRLPNGSVQIPGPEVPTWAKVGSTWLGQPLQVTPDCRDYYVANVPDPTPSRGQLPANWVYIMLPDSDPARCQDPRQLIYRATWPGDAQRQYGATNKGAILQCILDSAIRRR